MQFKEKIKQIIPKDFDRLTILMGMLFLLMVLIVVRLFTLQVVQNRFYTALASDQHEISQILRPDRGEIYIRDGEDVYPLATNREFYQVYADPRRIDDPVQVTEDLSQYVTMPKEDLLNILSKHDDPYEIIEKKVSKDRFDVIESLELPGIYGLPEMYRYYISDNISSHISGFVGLKDDKPYGFYGIEGYFNDLLAGTEGFFQTERDVAGRWIVLSDKQYQEAEDGADIVLTIDNTVQFMACKTLNEAVQRYDAQGGAVVILDPTTGKIISMCSNPDFNPNYYSDVESGDVYNNSSIFKAYEPGSIFKPITMAAAIDMDYVQPDTKFFDEGFVKIDEHTIRNADNKKYEEVTMAEVLENSINTGMVHIAKLLGNDKLRDYVERFGFGQTSGIELQTEVGGNITALNKISHIFGATAAFGQGITATPLQMAQSYAAIANGGVLMQPYIVDEIRHPNGEVEVREPKVLRQVLSTRTSVLMGGMLTSVITKGHAEHAGVPGYYLAGKTGTAQIAKEGAAGYEEDAYNHSFVGYGPVDNPRFVIAVKLERPSAARFSASTAAPVFGDLAEFLLNYYAIPPDF